MHNNYYFFKQLVPALASKLVNSTLTDCFSQNKDELILVFELNTNEKFFVKASLESHFSCLSFPKNYARAKRNSINIFDSLNEQTIASVNLIDNERAFIFNFNNGDQLLFKLYGNQSNLIYFSANGGIEIFKKKLKGDEDIKIKELDRPLDISFKALEEADWNIRQVIPTLDKVTAKELASRLDMSTNKEQAFIDFIRKLNTPTIYLDHTVIGFRLNLIKTTLVHTSFTDPIIAITSFFEQEVKLKSINSVKTKLVTSINSQLSKSTNYVKKLTKKLAELSQGSSNKQKADILMANLHTISVGSKSVELFNFYDNGNIIISLNPLQTPQKNAERYYRKAKNEAKEIAVLTQNIDAKISTISNLQERLITIKNCTDIKPLLKLLPQQAIKTAEPLPYKEFTADGFVILVGKNAKHNDTLTLKIAKKDDLWLHAKDVSGSHVVIKQVPGKPFPTYIIEKAAQLAAYYSKRRTDTLCPVLYTPKKYVRKKKGTPAGAMFVEKEKVLLVEPSIDI